MQKEPHYDIAIIGAGVTGLSSAYHLGLTKPLKVCLSEANEADSTSESSAHMIAGGLIDNFTRIVQRHGFEKAKDAWAYSNHAFDALLEFANKERLGATVGTRNRLIETEDEWTECSKAVDELKQADFRSEITRSLPKGVTALLGRQIDEPKAATLDAQKLLKHLRKLSGKVERLGATTSVTRESQHFKVVSQGKTITAEVIIFANHLSIPKFLPGLEAVLVSSQDQWERLRTDGRPLPFPVGSLLTWRHGHYWASIESPTQICMGGARFLRPLAGFEQKSPELSEKVSKHLPDAWKKYFPDHPLTERIEQKAGLDIRPCDEIPVIGPMFGESGIFLAAGYMGQGLTLGFKAGQSLANIVLGKPDELPRFFWPERHRSLADRNE